jgi:hypothetical protein
VAIICTAAVLIEQIKWGIWAWNTSASRCRYVDSFVARIFLTKHHAVPRDWPTPTNSPPSLACTATHRRFRRTSPSPRAACSTTQLPFGSPATTPSPARLAPSTDEHNDLMRSLPPPAKTASSCATPTAENHETLAKKWGMLGRGR